MAANILRAGARRRGAGRGAEAVIVRPGTAAAAGRMPTGGAVMAANGLPAGGPATVHGRRCAGADSAQHAPRVTRGGGSLRSTGRALALLGARPLPSFD